MISVFACTGYKYYGSRPPVHYPHSSEDSWSFRDNMLYLSIAFTDWQNDQQMLRFLLDTHVAGAPFDFVAEQIRPFIEDNMTPQLLHLLVSQHSDVQQEALRFWVGPHKPGIPQADGAAVDVEEHIAKWRDFYAAEQARWHEEYEQEQALQEKRAIQREERRLKREKKKQSDSTGK